MIFLRRYKTYIKQHKTTKKYDYYKSLLYEINHITIIHITLSMFSGIRMTSRYVDEYFDCGIFYRRDIICEHGKPQIISELIFNNSENQRYGNYRYIQSRLDLCNNLSNKKNIICNIKGNIPKSAVKHITRNMYDHKVRHMNNTSAMSAIISISASLYVNKQHRKTINYLKSFND